MIFFFFLKFLFYHMIGCIYKYVTIRPRDFNVFSKWTPNFTLFTNPSPSAPVLSFQLFPQIFSPISSFSGNIFLGSKWAFEGTLRSKSETSFFFFVVSPSFPSIHVYSQIALSLSTSSFSTGFSFSLAPILLVSVLD